LQLRMDAFNALNRPQFANINTDPRSPFFGVLGGSTIPAQVNFAARYTVSGQALYLEHKTNGKKRNKRIFRHLNGRHSPSARRGTMTRKSRKFRGDSCLTSATMPDVNCPESIRSDSGNSR